MKRIFIGPIQHTNYLVSSSTVEPTAVQGQSINKKTVSKKSNFFLSMASGITHKVGERTESFITEYVVHTFGTYEIDSLE